MSYCNQCGAKQVKELTGEYSTKTGKPTYRMICSKSPCEHYAHDFDYTKNSILGFLTGREVWCRRCKKWFSL